MNTVARTLGVWMLAGAALVAADFWDEKDFTTWSDKEVEKMLTDSPWAKEVRVPISGPRGGGNAVRGGGLGLGGGGGSRGRSGDFGAAPRRMSLTVSWRTALPIKQGFVRTETGPDARIEPQHQEFLEQDEQFYVVAVSGLPAQFEQMAQDPDGLVAETLLKLDKRDPLLPEGTEVFREGELVTIVWFFSRTVPITLDDKDVEFITTLGPNDFKKKFKLKDMEFGGELTL